MSTKDPKTGEMTLKKPMKFLQVCTLFLLGLAMTAACVTTRGGAVSTTGTPTSNGSVNTRPAEAATNPFPVIHVFVALCDNINQGIVPVSATLGNGDNPNTNLYWGAAFGVKTFFSKSRDWELVSETKNPAPRILDRVIFKRRGADVFIVADAYQGKEISQAIWDFLEAASGKAGTETEVAVGNRHVQIQRGW